MAIVVRCVGVCVCSLEYLAKWKRAFGARRCTWEMSECFVFHRHSAWTFMQRYGTARQRHSRERLMYNLRIREFCEAHNKLYIPTTYSIPTYVYRLPYGPPNVTQYFLVCKLTTRKSQWRTKNERHKNARAVRAGMLYDIMDAYLWRGTDNPSGGLLSSTSRVVVRFLFIHTTRYAF